MPVAGYRPAGGHPAVIANCFSLRARAGESKTDRKEKGEILLLSRQGTSRRSC